ncbi:MAG: hypothetical protein ACRELG_06230 [Gemmataceae bacterium]
MTMVKGLRAALYTIAALASLLGLWGILTNAAVPLIYGKQEWNFFEGFEKWDDSGASGHHHPEFRFPWWAISWQTPCPYLDPYLAGPVGYGFYALCFIWGMGTIIMLRSYLRSFAGRVFWSVCLFCTWWLMGLGGIVAQVIFFVSIAREAFRAGLWP